MSTPEDMDQENRMHASLDRALARTLVPPPLPRDFRRRLDAAIARSAAEDHAALRRRIEGEYREGIESIDGDYVRLRQRTLGSLVGGAFAAGVAVMLALPWLRAHFGPDALWLLPAGGALAGVGLSIPAWWRGSSLARLLG
jgi:hypothetical protein